MGVFFELNLNYLKIRSFSQKLTANKLGKCIYLTFMNKWLFVGIYIMLMIVIAFMPIYHNLSHFWAVVLAAIVAAIENMLDKFRLYITLFFSNKWIIIIVTSVLTLISLFIMVLSLQANNFDFRRVIDMMQFVLQGAIIGVILRQLFLSVVLNSLFGRSARIQRLLLMLGLAVVIWLFPANSRYSLFQGFYILGVAFGLIAHIAWRSLLHNRNRKSRYSRGVMKMIEGNDTRLTTDEENAYKLFIGNKRRKFNSLFRTLENDEKLTPRLKILKAHSFRVAGKYADALLVVDNELENDNRETNFDDLFLLQKALAHSELNENEKMYNALNKGLHLKKDNFLLRATLALRLAEELSLENIQLNEESRRPLRIFREALFKNTSEAGFEVLSDLFSNAIPIRWGFIQDVYGYTLLKAGDFSFSKDLFLNCIEKEPSFSSSYLHLGEWYVAWSMKDSKNAAKHLALAKDCFFLAESLEKNKSSRISKRAKAFRKKHCELDDNSS